MRNPLSSLGVFSSLGPFRDFIIAWEIVVIRYFLESFNMGLKGGALYYLCVCVVCVLCMCLVCQWLTWDGPP
ncbi:hypothetical protein BC939DRAFT_441970 [Gamsiella multidivaricata]|uniref:uncharacterized protein n=1 Tax=Gamsiella multidivaricata TaxID=101098 RepID=UPI00222082B9|nr:uncharacterized protein BC939DRAFT_441970 [Gamsiella multidivaricata]KAI7829458.1 hypothetical protein BC939DRAFT_441970 [Gamsiella multidivaricata]